MLEEIKYLEDFTKDLDFRTFLMSEDKRRVVSMTLINIGELVRHLTKEFRREQEDIPFDDILGLRDVAAHGYKSLRFDDIWEMIHTDIPYLKEKIETLLSDEEGIE